MFKLFKQRLLETGIPANNIISIALDDDQQRELRDPYALSDYVRQRCTNPQEKYVLLLDEIQYAIAKDELKNTNEPMERYNIKNKRYFEYPSKFYCTDIGLRNVRLGLRQQEQTELRPFDAIDDSFTKIVISKSYGKRWFNKKGILRLGILDFLLDTFLLDNQR